MFLNAAVWLRGGGGGLLLIPLEQDAHCLAKSKSLHNKVSRPEDKESCLVGMLRRKSAGTTTTYSAKNTAWIFSPIVPIAINKHCQIQWKHVPQRWET